MRFVGDESTVSNWLSKTLRVELRLPGREKTVAEVVLTPLGQHLDLLPTRPGGGIGRRATLRSLWGKPLAGSTPVLGT